MRKTALWILLALSAAGGATYYYFRHERSTSEEKYRTDSVSRGDVTMTVTATGTVSAVTTVQVGSQVSGIIARLHADFNSPVRKGQLLAELDPTPFLQRLEQRRADLLQAQVQERRAKIDFERQDRLLHDGLTAQADFDAAKANYDAARAQVEQVSATLRQAETDLTYSKIASPIDGVVVARQYDVGQTVAASFQAPTLFTIAQDLTKMQVQADVDQSDIGRIHVGQVARFTVDAYPEQEFRGEISQIRLNATVNQNVITYPVILTVPNPDEKLRPQMTANVSLEVATVKDVLRVPNAALRFRPTQDAGGQRSARAETGAPGASAPGAEPSGVRGKGGSGGSFTAAAAALEGAAEGGPGRGGRTQAIYVQSPSGELKRIAVRTGISDGKFTEIAEGEVEIGDKVVVGAATSRGDASQRPPGGGGRFF